MDREELYEHIVEECPRELHVLQKYHDKAFLFIEEAINHIGNEVERLEYELAKDRRIYHKKETIMQYDERLRSINLIAKQLEEDGQTTMEIKTIRDILSGKLVLKEQTTYSLVEPDPSKPTMRGQ